MVKRHLLTSLNTIFEGGLIIDCWSLNPYFWWIDQFRCWLNPKLEWLKDVAVQPPLFVGSLPLCIVFVVASARTVRDLIQNFCD